MQNGFSKEVKDFTRAMSGIYGGDIKSTELSLNAWRERAQRTRTALQMLRDDFDRQKTEADMELSVPRAKQKKDKLDRDYADYCKTAITHIQVDLDAVKESIRKAFDAAMVRLTDQQIRVLQALSMRSSLTGDELSFYAGALNESLPALRVLADIAGRNNIPFPRIMSVDEFEDSILELQNIFDRYAPSIGQDKGEMDYMDILFWRPDTPFREGRLFDALDNANFLIANTPEPQQPQAEMNTGGGADEPAV